MFVWRNFNKYDKAFGVVRSVKVYKMLLLFGIIPLFISITTNNC